MSTAADLTKRCPVCGETKSRDEFPPRKDRPSGVMSRCRSCDAAQSAAYYAENQERRAAYSAANRDRRAAQARERRRVAKQSNERSK